MSKLVYGVGINDAEYPVQWTDAAGKRQSCKYWRTWESMLQRCYSEKLHKKYPTYLGCSVFSGWHVFSAFKEWMESQDWQGMVLDKDLLCKGNKVYSPDTCVFICKELNNFVMDSGLSRSGEKVGASFNKAIGKFHASCRNPFTGKREHLGFYDSQDEAHKAWRERKHEIACMYADMQTDQRLSISLRSMYAKQGAQYYE